MTKKKTDAGIKFDQHNFRLHSGQNKQMIRKSLSECGAGRSVLIDNEGELIAGNGVYEQAQALGIPTRIIETDGTELVVVKRTDLSTQDDKRKKLAFADNAASDAVEWNVPEIQAHLDPIVVAEFGVTLPSIEMSDEEIERKRKEFAARMEAGELSEDDEEYQEFVAKFEQKKTTDDCYTPETVYDAVADYVAKRYGLNRANFVRPFYPNGDYQKERYKSGDVVVDNPPFSILSQIVDWYNAHGIRYFLFAPHLTLFGTCANRCTALCIDVSVTYENGANVSTSFLTNLEDADVVFKSEPELYKVVADADEANRKRMRKELPKYTYPDNVITTPVVARWSKYGIPFEARRSQCQIVGTLDAQREHKKAIFGKGYFISEPLKAEREKAEREKAEREKAEREKAMKWELSDRERAIIANLK